MADVPSAAPFVMHGSRAAIVIAISLSRRHLRSVAAACRPEPKGGEEGY